MTKTIMILAIATAFLAGSLVTGTVVFAEDAQTKLEKNCSKIPKSPDKIKPECQLLEMINAIPASTPHFSGDHADLTNVLPDQHHTAYTDAEAVTAVGEHTTDTDTNSHAGTLCDPNQYLDGDGTCKTIPSGADGDDCTIDGTVVTCGETSSDIQGPAGVIGFYTKSKLGSQLTGGNAIQSVTADCEAGDIATGGGYSITGASTVNTYFVGAIPAVPDDGSKGTPNSYKVSVQVPIENTFNLQTFVHCADITPP